LTPMQNPAVLANTTFTENFLPRWRGATTAFSSRKSCN
jgi:hypothetical protein